MEKYLTQYFWLAAILICLPAVWALFVPGYFGASDDLHIGYLYEMDQTLKLGQFPPRFVPDLNNGFGYPLFTFIFPFPFYLGDLFHHLGLSLVDSIKAVFLISIPISFLGMFQLLKAYSSFFISLAGATLYIYTPYRATDLYVRGAIGEILSFVFLPFIIMTLLKTMEEKKLNFRFLGLGALSIGALIVTHDITAYMFLFFVAVLGCVLAIIFRKYNLLIRGILLGLLGLLISLYFWYPALTDSKLMKYDTVYNFQDHFPTMMQLIKPYWGYGASVPGPYDGMSFFIGVVNWLAFLIGLPLLIIKWKKFNLGQKILLSWGIGVFLISILMMNYRSTPIWQTVPQLPYFQFPWRFLIMTTLVSPLFLIALDKLKFAKQIGLGLVLIIIAINAFQFRPNDFLDRKDNYYLEKYIPTIPKSLGQATEEVYLPLPKNATYRPDRLYPAFWTNSGQTLLGQELGLQGRAEVNFATPQVVNFNKYNFPGWVATIDNEPARINYGYPFGQVAIGVPAGQHQIQVKFQETNLKIFLDLLSLLSLLIVLKLMLPLNWSRKNA